MFELACFYEIQNSKESLIKICLNVVYIILEIMSIRVFNLFYAKNFDIL